MSGAIRLSRRMLLNSSAVAVVGTTLGGCSQAVGTAARVAVANPAVKTWLLSLAASVGANVVTDMVKEGPDKASAQWFKPAWDWVMGEWKQGAIASTALASDGPPPFLVLTMAAVPDTEPLYEEAGMIINYGADAIRLPNWAWQTMVMFAEDYLSGRDDTSRAEAKALMSISLAPKSSKVDRHESWANAVASLSYDTVRGPVDIAKVENADHSYIGVIKISGIPDATNSPRVKQYALPTVSA